MNKLLVLGDSKVGKSSLISLLSNSGLSLICENRMAQCSLCIVLMFDLTLKESLKRVKILYHPETSLLANKSKSFFVLVGNKSDLPRKVSQEKAESFASESGMFYIETSAKNQKNIDLVQKIIRIRSSFILKKKLIQGVSNISPYPKQIPNEEKGKKVDNKKEGFEQKNKEHILNIQITKPSKSPLKASKNDTAQLSTPAFRHRDPLEDKENCSLFSNYPNELLLGNSELHFPKNCQKMSKNNHETYFQNPLSHQEGSKTNLFPPYNMAQNKTPKETPVYSHSKDAKNPFQPKSLMPHQGTHQNAKLHIDPEKFLTSQESLPQVQVLTADFKNCDSSKNIENAFSRGAVKKPTSIAQIYSNELELLKASQAEVSRITSHEDYHFDSEHNSLPNYDLSKTDYFSKESGISRSLNIENTVEVPYESVSNPFRSKNLMEASSFVSGDQSMHHASSKNKETKGTKKGWEDKYANEKGENARNFDNEIEDLEKSIKKIEENYKKRSEELLSMRERPEEKEETNFLGSNDQESSFLSNTGLPQFDMKSIQNRESINGTSRLMKDSSAQPSSNYEFDSGSSIGTANSELPLPNMKKEKDIGKARPNLLVTIGVSIICDGVEQFHPIGKGETIHSFISKIMNSQKALADFKELKSKIDEEIDKASRLNGQKHCSQKSFLPVLGSKVIPRSVSASCLSERETQRSSNASSETNYTEYSTKNKSLIGPVASRNGFGFGRPPTIGPVAKIDLTKNKSQLEGAESKKSTGKSKDEKKKPIAGFMEKDVVIGSMSIQLNDGSFKELLVRKNDKPETLASSFLRTHALKQSYYPKLLDNIKKMKQSWAETQENENQNSKFAVDFESLSIEKNPFKEKQTSEISPMQIHGKKVNQKPLSQTKTGVLGSKCIIGDPKIRIY